MNNASFNFGQWVKQVRKERNLSRQKVADRSGGRNSPKISQQYVHFIETGKATNIGSDKLTALARGLGIPVEILETALFRQTEPTIPVLGRAAAGTATNSLKEEYQNETFPYTQTNNTLTGYEIMGDSMAPKISHGDLALITALHTNDPLISGAVYLIKTKGKVTCKYILEDPANPDNHIIRAENKHLYPDTVLDRKTHQVLGRVVEVRKSISLHCPTLSD